MGGVTGASGNEEIRIGSAFREIHHFVRCLERYPDSPRRAQWLDEINKLRAEISNARERLAKNDTAT